MLLSPRRVILFGFIVPNIVHAFTPFIGVKPAVGRVLSNRQQQQLSMTGYIMQSSTPTETEDHASYIMNQARACAFGDAKACTMEEAQYYLNEIVHIQSGCVSGTLVGHDLCDEQDLVAEIVSHLRLKAKGIEPTVHGKEPHSVIPYVEMILATLTMVLVVAALHSNLIETKPPEVYQEWYVKPFF